MGRPKAIRQPVLSREFLDLLHWATVGESFLTLSVETLRALIAQARFGIGFATIAAKSDAERSASGKKAAEARWAARRAARAAEMPCSESRKIT